MNTHNTTQVAPALKDVHQSIETFEQRYERPSGSVQLLAVSKRKPIEAIQAAMQAGQRAFGENYMDEALEKIQALQHGESGSELEWHFIGAIQSRKTASIAENFHWAHGVDRFKVARRLSEQRPDTLQPLNICLQVNTDNESGKAGVSFDELEALAAECAELPGIVLRGLMAIPAPRTELEEQREVFARLRKSLQNLQGANPTMDTLSMGMSGDMEAAIAEGATIVRVGTAIFGERDN